jgi:cytochrome c biogenesis protein CcdA
LVGVALHKTIPTKLGLPNAICAIFRTLSDSTVTLPLLYGIGTALPVLVFATILALSAQSVGRAFNAISKVEWWARMITGWTIIVVGVWLTLRPMIE